MSTIVIYKITNLINNKIYVGKDSRNRSNYFGSGTLIRLAIKKYGKKNFKKEILEFCTEYNWKEKEISWILKLNSRDSDIGYNILEGGDGAPSGKTNPFYGIPLVSDHKKKISEAIKNHWKTRQRKPKVDSRKFWYDLDGNLHVWNKTTHKQEEKKDV